LKNYEQALTMVLWYGARWYIEQIFRLLKRQGFGIEETEIESWLGYKEACNTTNVSIIEKYFK